LAAAAFFDAGFLFAATFRAAGFFFAAGADLRAPADELLRLAIVVSPGVGSALMR